MDAKDGEDDDDQLILLPGQTDAYVLRVRKFCLCDINLLREVVLNENGFEDLALLPRHKKLLKALVSTHARGIKPRNATEIDSVNDKRLDLVQGKGKGLIILLHGVPGVGKTSTEETIADGTERPLYPLTCGDIGETPEQVEKYLESAFTLGHRWGCVLLLDEADVFFIARRDKADMRRNAMVSVTCNK